MESLQRSSQELACHTCDQLLRHTLSQVVSRPQVLYQFHLPQQWLQYRQRNRQPFLVQAAREDQGSTLDRWILAMPMLSVIVSSGLEIWKGSSRTSYKSLKMLKNVATETSA